jgi:hypothetical protein
MSYDLDPGFGRGQVLGTQWYHPIEKTDPITGQSTLYTKKNFTDVHAKTGAVLSNEIVTCVAVKNTDAAGTTPWAPGAPKIVSGFTGVVDEYLPKVTGTGATALGGCKPGEICWLVVMGPYTDPADNKRKRLSVTGTVGQITRTLPDGTEEDVEVVIDPDVVTKDATTPDVTTPDTTDPTTP